VGVDGEPGTEHVGGGNEGEEPKSPAGIAQILADFFAVEGDSRGAEHHKDNVGEACQPQQRNGDREGAVVIHRDRHDAGGHDQREIAGVKGPYRVADAGGFRRSRRLLST
jgi:hypothetical protein